MRHPGQIHIDGFGHPIVVRHNPRARRITLRVSQTKHQAILTLPPRAKIADARNFVTGHLGWLQSQIEKIPPLVPFAEGNTIPLRGKDYRLCFAEARARRGIVTSGTFDAAPALFVTGGESHAPRRLLDWLKKQARRDLDTHVAGHAKTLRLRPKRISVRDQTSRWGSCSTTGVLSFSWRLIMAPPIVLDYVAAHEVAHLAEMNHGPRFWRLVERTMPEMEKAQRWLKHHGNTLHRYGLPQD